MSSQSVAVAAAPPAGSLDSRIAWFWQFLKNELSPYPGRAWVVGRMTIAATIVMIIVMTFRMPLGFLGGIYTLFLTRENPTLTMRAAVRVTLMYAAATVYTICGVILLVGSPITHFIWIVFSLLLAFYLIRVIPDYFTAIGFGFTLAAAIPLWDETLLTVNQRTENTLWVGASVVLGAAVTVAVEYLFRRVHPVTDLTLAIETRLEAVEQLLRQIATRDPVFRPQEQLSLYAQVGASRLRRLVLRSGNPPQFIVQMSAAVALIGRLIDLASSLQIARSNQHQVVSDEDAARCLHLAGQIAKGREDLKRLQLPREIEIPTEAQPSGLPFLPEMERTVALIPHAFSGTEDVTELFLLPPVDEDVSQGLFVADALQNPEYLKFAIRGTLATMLAYVAYQGFAWPGLSTSVATAIITALTTIGASRQKQFLRLGGAIVGGFGFGMGAQVFILPHIDGIAGFSLLFAVVTAVAAWISTGSARISYLGIQLALAFYLINLQEFAIQYSLAVARDRVVGVLLGLVCMWLVFDRLWVRDALQEMQSGFSRNLQSMAEIMELSHMKDRAETARHVLKLRDQINAGFSAVRAQADAVVFEFGPSRPRKLQIRDDIRRWQPTVQILLQVQVTFLQYLFELRFPDLPQTIAEAQTAFENDMTATIRVMSDEVAGKHPTAAPDIQQSAARLREEIERSYGQSIPPTLADMITLTQNLAQVVAPLYDDIHATFSTPELAVVHHPHLRHKAVMA